MKREQLYPTQVTIRLARSDRQLLAALAARKGCRPGALARTLVLAGLRGILDPHPMTPQRGSDVRITEKKG